MLELREESLNRGQVAYVICTAVRRLQCDSNLGVQFTVHSVPNCRPDGRGTRETGENCICVYVLLDFKCSTRAAATCDVLLSIHEDWRVEPDTIQVGRATRHQTSPSALTRLAERNGGQLRDFRAQ